MDAKALSEDGNFQMERHKVRGPGWGTA